MNHRMFEIKTSKEGETWYHYLWVGGYYPKSTSDETIISQIERQHNWLKYIKVIRDS